MGAVSLLVVGGLVAGAAPALAHAHGADVAAMHTLQWRAEPWLLLLLAVSLILYAAGVRRLWLQAGTGRGIGRWQAASFAAGWLTLAGALVGPLDAYAAQLFSAHMLQHELLMIVAAPLLVLGRPLAAWTWGLAPRHRQWIVRATRWRWLARAWSTLTQPLTAWALHALALWIWHVPQLFEAALHNEAVHVLQHASFLGTALLFWWTAIGSDPRSRTKAFAMASLFTTMMHTSALGALLTFAASPWYASYAATTAAFGLSPVEDQQLGGLVMWVPGGLAYLIAGLVVVAQLLARPAVNPASAARPVLPR